MKVKFYNVCAFLQIVTKRPIHISLIKNFLFWTECRTMILRLSARIFWRDLVLLLHSEIYIYIWHRRTHTQNTYRFSNYMTYVIKRIKMRLKFSKTLDSDRIDKSSIKPHITLLFARCNGNANEYVRGELVQEAHRPRRSSRTKVRHSRPKCGKRGACIFNGARGTRSEAGRVYVHACMRACVYRSHRNNKNSRVEII